MIYSLLSNGTSLLGDTGGHSGEDGSGEVLTGCFALPIGRALCWYSDDRRSADLQDRSSRPPEEDLHHSPGTANHKL